MKTFINRLLFIVLLISAAISCKDPDNAIYDVFDGQTYGAVLRGIEVTSANYDKADLNSMFEIIVEEQDENKGGLLAQVNVYVTYTDKFLDDGIDYSQPETSLKSVMGSEFTVGENGLPRATISVTLQEVITLFGLSDGEYNAGDLIVTRFELVLTDGRTFSNEDASGSLQGSYFQSPYKYTGAILCAPMAGDYRVAMHDSYGDGWQTDADDNGIQVTLGDGTVLEVGMCSAYNVTSFCVPGDYEAEDIVTIPVGQESAEWWFPGDVYGEISFEVYAPTGELLFASGGPGETGGGSLPVVKCAL